MLRGGLENGPDPERQTDECDEPTYRYEYAAPAASARTPRQAWRCRLILDDAWSSVGGFHERT